MSTEIHEVEIAKWDALASVPASDEELLVADPGFGARLHGVDAAIELASRWASSFRSTRSASTSSSARPCSTISTRAATRPSCTACCARRDAAFAVPSATTTSAAWLLERARALGRLCRYVVITMVK
jgi:hypothetical protein